MRKTLTTAFIVSLGLAIAAPAAADPPVATVTFQRSELENADTLNAVYARILDATNDVCRRANLGADDCRAAVGRCREQALEIALDQAAIPALSAYHERLHERQDAPVNVADAQR
jgi:UrcA family protein